MSCSACDGIEISGARIDDSNQVIRQLERRKSPVSFRRRQNLVSRILRVGPPKRAGNHHPVGWPDHQSTAEGHQYLATLFFELPPELVRALYERDIQRMLEVLLANYPAVAVRGAELVTLAELLDAEHVLA